MSKFNITQHLLDRMGHAYFKEKMDICLDTKIATFYLYNLSGQIVGYQRYSPLLTKESSNHGKYFTYSIDGCAIYGLESLDYNVDTLYITEGIFNASILSEYGNAIAVLSNNPKKLREQLWLLSQQFNTIAVCDYGKAGSMLAKYANSSIVMPTDDDINDIYQKSGYEGVTLQLLEVL